MTNKIKALIILIIILLIITLLRNKQDINQVKVGSRLNDIELKQAEFVELKNKESNTVVLDDSPIKKHKSKTNPKTKQDSYLDLYEKLNLALDCKIIFKTKSDFDRNIDPYDNFKNKVRLKSNNRQIEATKIQIQALSDFLTQCDYLKDEVEFLIKKNNYKTTYNYSHPVISYSSKRFFEATPDTEEEKELDRILKNTGKISRVQMNFGAQVNGKSSLPKEEKKQIEKEIKELRDLMYSNDGVIDTSYEGHTQRSENRKRLKQAIEQKYQYLHDAIYINAGLLQKYRDVYAVMYPEMFRLLKTQYAYVFIEVLREVSIVPDNHGKKSHNYDRNIKFIKNLYPLYQSLSDIVFNNVGFKNRPYFDQIYTPSKNLFLCYLGLDCSASSRIVRNYCLGLHNFPMYFESCGQDLESFYFSTLISNNQISDVNTIIDFMVNEYAQ